MTNFEYLKELFSDVEIKNREAVEAYKSSILAGPRETLSENAQEALLAVMNSENKIKEFLVSVNKDEWGSAYKH